MEAETVLNLFDSIWFNLAVLEKRQPKNSTSSSQHQIQQKAVSSQKSFHRRSKSDQLRSLTIEIPSPDRRLQTILSDKEMASSESPKIAPQLIKVVPRVERSRKRLSKSLSELEFEEVKGFMDLGFVFSDDDVDSDLVEIIPGLHKLGHKTEWNEETCGVRARPYLSEAWESREKEEKALMKWRVPSVRNDMEMKDSLKSWAHTIASAIR